MKKTLKITGIVIGSLLALIILAAVLVPVLFKKQLTELAKNAINKSVNAQVDFKDVNISIFKNFPDVTLSLKDITVVGLNEFRDDTLAAVKSFGVSVNVMSYLRKDIIDVKSITIDNPRLHAIILENGKVNWDIAKVDTTAPAAPIDTTAAPSSFTMNLNKVEIIDGQVLYEDLAGKMLAGINNINFKLKGNMADDKTMLDLETSIGKINVFVNNMRLIYDLSLGMKTKVDADLKNMIFAFQDNETTIQRMALQVNGTVKMVGAQQENMDIDLTYAAKIESLKDLLGLIPSSMMPEVKDMETRGSMALKGWVKGLYSETSIPQVWAELQVADGYIKYPQLPESIKNLNIDMKALYDGNDDNNTAIDINRFHFEVAGNPFDITTNIRTPMTDADIKATAKGIINFASLARAIPMEGMNLTGVLNANVNFAGRMSAIEKEAYDKLNLAGTIGLQNLSVKSKDLPMEVQITNTNLAFSPRYVELKSFSGKMGKSDLEMNGRLENFLNYALKGEVLKGNLNLASHLIDCNELMAASGGTQAKPAAKDTMASAPLSVIMLPGDIDFTMNLKADKILYDKLVLSNANGSVSLRNSELIINNLNMGFAGGTMALSGKYKATSPTKALAGLNMNLKNVEVGSVLSSFDMFNKILPVLGALGGKVSLGFNFATDLDGNMMPVLTSLSGAGNVQSDSLRVIKSEQLNKLTSLVGLKGASDGATKMLKSLNASFAVKDGKIQIAPFAVKLAGMNMMMGGAQGLDQVADFQVDLAVPAQQLAGKANDLLKQIGLPGNTASTINVGVAIGGTISSPTFKLVAPKYMDNKGITQQATDQIKDIVSSKATDLLQGVISGKTSSDSTKKNDAQKANDAINQVKDLFKKR